MTPIQSGGTTVRKMLASDVDAVVELQVAFLEGSVVTKLGTAFLSQFHRASLAHPSVQAFVATDHQAIVGFLEASTDVHAYNSFVKPRVLGKLGLALLSPIRWRLVPLFVQQTFRNVEPQPSIPAELLLLVVHPAARRQHIAGRMVAELECTFHDRGIKQYRVAVRTQLAVARQFYQATGFELEQELTVLGAPMTYLTKIVASRQLHQDVGIAAARVAQA
jgi:ribosomal protein S18 acetylase RimI-like enzyme